MHTPNRDEIHAACQQGEGAIVQLINQLIQELGLSTYWGLDTPIKLRSPVIHFPLQIV